MTSWKEIRSKIEDAWESQAETISPGSEVALAIEAALNGLDNGSLRVAEKSDGKWITHRWLKMAILLSFRSRPNRLLTDGPNGATSWDKVPSKFQGWSEPEFLAAGFRAVPGCTVRHGSYIAPGVVLMPSFVNIGANVAEGTMVDTWATVGSCAQIGKNCHISGGVGIGGVLEPIQSSPVIIEDDCFIGARSEVAEGVLVEQGSVLSMGVYIGASTKIVDRASGEIYMGRVPSYSVVVPGTLPGKQTGSEKINPGLYAAVIVKRVDARTRSKTSINQLLRAG